MYKKLAQKTMAVIDGKMRGLKNLGPGGLVYAYSS